MVKKKKLNMTTIRKLLMESVFDPRQGGPLSVIIDAHGDDPSYLEKRAIEIIHEGIMAINQNQPDVYKEKMQKAVCLLIVARGTRELQ